MGYKVGFKFKNQDHLSFNAVVFATKEEADDYGMSKMMVWYMPIGYEVVYTDEKPNYKVEGDKIVPIKEGSFPRIDKPTDLSKKE
jgi:hypothetical protein